MPSAGLVILDTIYNASGGYVCQWVLCLEPDRDSYWVTRGEIYTGGPTGAYHLCREVVAA